MAVLIKDSQKLLRINKKQIRKVTEALLTFSGFQDRDLSILFVDNRQIQRLNRKFFERDRATNVISFSYIDGLPGEVLGDIIISVERTHEEAQAVGITFHERLCALIVHGLVHIMGYDHETGLKESRRMKYKEKKLMQFVLNCRDYRELADE